jgi:hypothetical protein
METRRCCGASRPLSELIQSAEKLWVGFSRSWAVVPALRILGIFEKRRYATGAASDE